MSTSTSVTPIELRNEILNETPGASEHLADIDTALFQLLDNGADAELLKEWLIDAVDLFDSATTPASCKAA